MKPEPTATFGDFLKEYYKWRCGDYSDAIAMSYAEAYIAKIDIDKNI